MLPDPFPTFPAFRSPSSDEKWTQYLLVLFSNHPPYPIRVTGHCNVDRIVEKADIKDVAFIPDYHLLPLVVASDLLHLVNGGAQRTELRFLKCNSRIGLP